MYMIVVLLESSVTHLSLGNEIYNIININLHDREHITNLNTKAIRPEDPTRVWAQET